MSGTNRFYKDTLAEGGKDEHMKKGVTGELLANFVELCPEETVQKCSPRPEG